MILRPKEIVIAIHLFLYIFWNLFVSSKAFYFSAS